MTVSGDRPRTATPLLACDSHLHIYDPRFKAVAPVVANAGVADFRALQQRLGTQRAVIVQPRAYGTDNAVTLAAIEALGLGATRGVAVLTPEVDLATLRRFHDGGIRGVRLSLYTPTHAATDFTMVEPLARLIAPLGWHLQLHWNAGQIAEHAAMLERLDCTLVFDHLARLPLPEGINHPGHAVVRRLLDRGRAWVKLSGPYLDSRVGAAGDYADVDEIARSWVRAAPQRMVWGSDWPHPTESVKPDDVQLLDLLDRWCDDAAVRRRVLVDNPAVLYGFDA